MLDSKLQTLLEEQLKGKLENDDQLLSIKELELIGVTDFIGIDKVINLEELTIKGCDSENIDLIFKLKYLKRLTIIATTITSVNGISSLDKLEHLDIIFTYVRDVRELLNGCNINYIRLLGNPILEDQFNELQTCIYPLNSSDQQTLWEIPSKDEWEFSTRMYEKYKVGSYSKIGRKAVLVIPGVSFSSKLEFNFSVAWSYRVLEDYILFDGHSPLIVMETNHKKLEEKDPDISSKFPDISTFNVMDYGKALKIIKTSNFSQSDEKYLTSFIERFKGHLFYQEKKESLQEYEKRLLKIKLPEWYLKQQEVFSLILPYDFLTIQLGVWDGKGKFEKEDKWFRYGFVGNHECPENPILKCGDKDLYNIALSDDIEVCLAINLADENDSKIYIYYSDSMTEDSVSEEGLYVEYQSYAHLLCHIFDMRLTNTDELVKRI